MINISSSTQFVVSSSNAGYSISETFAILRVIYNTLAKSNALISPDCTTNLHILVSDLCEETNRCCRFEG
jgi:hypothetical protein